MKSWGITFKNTSHSYEQQLINTLASCIHDVCKVYIEIYKIILVKQRKILVYKSRCIKMGVLQAFNRNEKTRILFASLQFKLYALR